MESKIIFFVDDIVVTEKIDLNELLQFDPGKFVPSLRMGLNIKKIIKDLEEIEETIRYLDDVLIFKEGFDSLNSELKEFVKGYFDKDIISKLSSVFLKAYYLQLLEEILKQNNIPSPKNKVEMFREKDFEVRDIKRYKIMDSIEQDQPSVNYHSHGTNEVSILKRENEKKRRLKPIRDLLEDIPNLVFSLKPCFMMSPLSVSQYINPKTIKFDVVILDHTYGPNVDSGSHLNANKFENHIKRMQELNMLNRNAQIFATHISHEGNPIHTELEEYGKEHGYRIAYDGLVVEV